MIRKAVMFLIALALVVSAVQAKGPAVVTTGFECTLIGPDGTTFYSATTSKEVVKEDNKVTITCRGIQPVPYPDKAVHLDFANTDIEYYTEFGWTQDWKEVITPSGQVTLKIKIDLKTKP